MKKIIHLSTVGFSIIEMMVSLAVFSVVVTISIGALLMLVASNETLQTEQSIMTNLSFALDSMTRELRTGTFYYCFTLNNDNNNILDNDENIDEELGLTEFLDCPSGRSSNNSQYQGIAFIEGGDSITGTAGQRILYFFDQDTGMIYRRVGSGPAQPIISSGIFLTEAEFFVTGSTPLRGTPGAIDQPIITIFLEAREKDDVSLKPYRIQTTITQRSLDI